MKTVLTVDDSPSVRQMVRLVLGSAGYSVAEATNGSEGLTKAKAQRFDMVVTDLNMPGMDGLTLIRELRTLASFRGVPIVFLTTESDPIVKQQAKAAGATGWMTKPFQKEQLLSVVQKFIG
jgi:two-component system, chemotaxis family, chemotaxis protein CheY